MKTKIFNTKFEVSMRLLLLLHTFNKGLDEERILYLDFFTIYAKNYKLGNENINGDSKYMLNEFTAQRKLIKDSIKELVLEGFINVKNTKDGFLYIISNEGMLFCNSMTSDYSKKYKNQALITKEYFLEKEIKDIKNYSKRMEDSK